MTVLREVSTGAVSEDSLAQWRFSLFARMLAAAALFHLAGNTRSALTTSPGLAVASVLLGAAAAVAVLAPRRLWGVAALCVAIPVTAWYEAPVVGNHWVLAAALSTALLLSGLSATLARPVLDLVATWRIFEVTARWTLLAAYAFAAFAKLNSDFFDPAVSCAVYYHNQLVGSWGLHLLQLSSEMHVARLVPIAAATIEVSIALALALPRARRLGLVVAVAFHWLLAMDLGQHFWDFSAVLFAAFLLFLDDSQVRRLRDWTSYISGRRLVRVSLLRASAVTLACLVATLNILPGTSGPVALVLLGHLAWWLYGTLVLVVVVLLAAVRRASDDPRPTQGLRVLIPVVVPVLVVLNGLTPYTELKTGFGWNMYSNLRTVNGESNHFLVPATLALSARQEDQVRVLDSSDPELARLAATGYGLVYSEFREYAHAHPSSSVTYERAGRVVHAERLRDDPAGRGGVSAVERRLRSYRLIDLTSSERCQPLFSPAR